MHKELDMRTTDRSGLRAARPQRVAEWIKAETEIPHLERAGTGLGAVLPPVVTAAPARCLMRGDLMAFFARLDGRKAKSSLPPGIKSSRGAKSLGMGPGTPFVGCRSVPTSSLKADLESIAIGMAPLPEKGDILLFLPLAR